MFAVKFGARDIIAAGIVLCLAAALLFLPFFWQEDGHILVISTPEGNAEYALNIDRTVQISSAGIELSVEIRNGEAHVRSSTCSDGICALSGHISHSGETIICAPAGVRLYVRGGDDDVDFVAG